MAVSAILIEVGWYVIWQFTHTYHIVVAGVTVISNACMIIGASAESARGMAVATILIINRTRIVRIGWHVRIQIYYGCWFACGSNLLWVCIR